MTRRRGFTLLELIAALSLTGLATLGGVLLLDQLTDAGARIVRQGQRVASVANGERLLRRLLLDAGASVDSAKQFRGDARSVELWTRCEVPAGWSEPCHVLLMIDNRGDSSALLAELAAGRTYSVRRYDGASELRYYDDTRSDSVWVRQWSSNVKLPVAIGLVVRGDTVVLPVGANRD